MGGKEARTTFCNECGWENPGGARFCSKCGAALQVIAADEPAPKRPAAAKEAGQDAGAAAPAPAEETVGRRVGIIVGAGLLVVVAIFLVFAMTGDDAAAPAPSQAMQQEFGVAQPLAPQFAARAEALRDSMAAVTGAPRIAVQRTLVDTYLSAGRFDLAAEETEAIAAETGSADDWRVAGNLYYDWMEMQPGQAPERAAFAKRAINAYRRVLRLEPDDLDVRTDMAVAYLSTADSPMVAISETAAVLARDSTHIQANFNRGIMLLQINRIDQAIEQFRRVQRLVGDPQDPISLRAQEAINSLTGIQNP